MTRSTPAVPSPDVVEAYRSLLRGERAEGERGSLVFCVSSDDLDEGKGDLFVALGLGRALSEAGWGVAYWPLSKWLETPSPAPDVAISMIESFVPGYLPDTTATIAWVRNWTAYWANLPYLADFDAVWSSSPASLAEIEKHYDGSTLLVPIAVDTDVFVAQDAAERDIPIVSTANFWGAERRITKALEQAAAELPVVWYGANGEHLRAAAVIDHRDPVGFFDLPAVYASSTIVVDDLIPPAEEFGNHNSRLFEGLASGALVVTSTADGLDALGLAEVPVWHDGDDLTATLRGLLADPAGTARLAAKLGAVVRRDHSYAVRAAAVADSLEAAVAHRRPLPPRSPAVRWIADLVAELRVSNRERDGHLVYIRRLEREAAEGSAREQEAGRAIDAYRAEAKRLADELAVIKGTRGYQALTSARNVVGRVRRR